MDYSSINSVTLVGYLANEPELKKGKGDKGRDFTYLSVVTNEVFTGQEAKKSTFHDVVVFGKRAHFCVDFLKKGTGIMVQGKLNKHFWEEGGSTRSRTQVVAIQVTFPPKTKEPKEQGEQEANGAGEDEPF